MRSQHNPHFYAVILAGGSGTRLWPVSRRRTPKQIQPFLDSDTLLQKTYHRLRGILPAEQILISTGESQYALVHRQLPRVPRQQYILEPSKRDTAVAIGYLATVLHARDPEAAFVTINSDHYIQNERGYAQTLAAVGSALQRHPSHTILVGVQPTYPETAYGYIQVGKALGNSTYRFRRFVEKPDRKTAERYLAAGNYLWNPALFAWRANQLLTLYRHHLPALARRLQRIEGLLANGRTTASAIAREFNAMQAPSIDYALMEKLRQKVTVVHGRYQFTDIGHWATLWSVLAAHPRANVTKGVVVTHDSHGNIIYNLTSHLVTTVGLSNTVVIQTPDALLVCPRERAPEVKLITELLTKQKLTRYL